MWALIIDNTVQEVTEIDPDGRFHPSLKWHPCDESVRAGWTFDAGEFSKPEEFQGSQAEE